MNPVENLLQNVTVGDGMDLGPLTLFPLLAENPTSPIDYLLLNEALEQKVIEITEVGDGGSVPELRVANIGACPVLVIEGEQLIGALQNRTLNSSVLIGGHSEVIIPVSCTEAGRWSPVSVKFRSSGRHSRPRLRHLKTQSVYENLCYGGKRRSDQHAVWNEVERVSATLGSHSTTRDYEVAHDEAQRRRGHEAEEVTLPEGTVGVAVVSANGVEVVDLFDSPDTLRGLMPTLMSGYLLAGMMAENGDGEVDRDVDVTALLRGVRAEEGQKFNAVGEGGEVHLVGPQMEGMALTCGDVVLHVALFPRV